MIVDKYELKYPVEIFSINNFTNETLNVQITHISIDIPSVAHEKALSGSLLGCIYDIKNVEILTNLRKEMLNNPDASGEEANLITMQIVQHSQHSPGFATTMKIREKLFNEICTIQPQNFDCITTGFDAKGKLYKLQLRDFENIKSPDYHKLLNLFFSEYLKIIENYTI